MPQRSRIQQRVECYSTWTRSLRCASLPVLLSDRSAFGSQFLPYDRHIQFFVQSPSLALTTSLTVLPSAFLPASAACAAFMTLPMSFIEEAPVSLIAAATAASISSRDAA